MSIPSIDPSIRPAISGETQHYIPKAPVTSAIEVPRGVGD